MKLMVNATSVASGKLTGIERFGLKMSQELYRIDTEIIVVAAQPIHGIPTAIISKLLSFNNSLLNNHEYIYRAIWDQINFRYLVEKHKPDLVFIPIQDGILFPSIKQIVTIHDCDVYITGCRQEINPLRTKIYHYKIPHILKYSSAVIAVSEFTKHGIVDSFGINPNKIHVIYNGYDELRFHVIENLKPTLDRYGLLSGNYFLFVGSILKHKNIVRLIRAFSLLDSQFVLVIAGACKDIDCLIEISKVTEELGISKSRLRYLNYVTDEDLPYLYNGAISYLLPSLHEGFGVPIIEAMACGTPVITSNCSAMPEVAGEAALLVDPYSVESITAAMREVLENTELVKTLKTAGLERAKLFRWSYSAQKLYELCKSVSES